jgi:hypothetical protein
MVVDVVVVAGTVVEVVVELGTAAVEVVVDVVGTVVPGTDVVVTATEVVVVVGVPGPLSAAARCSGSPAEVSAARAATSQRNRGRLMPAPGNNDQSTGLPIRGHRLQRFNGAMGHPPARPWRSEATATT